MMDSQVKVLEWPVVGEGEAPTFGHYLILHPTKRQIHDALKDGVISVKGDEQRGDDPVTGKEILNPAKMKKWAEYEHAGTLFLGQLNYSLHLELGTTFEITPDGKCVRIVGPILINDGRQRTYTIAHAVAQADQYGADGYDTEAGTTVSLWTDALSTTRKEMYAQLNGARGGDHASKSSAEWMAPEGQLQEIAKYLVENSRHLGQGNVNVKLDSVTRNDKRIAGFHTFVKALENGWGKRRLPTAKEQVKFQEYLVRFYNKLATVRPEMGVLDLGDRQKAREELITSNPLFLYGAMQVAISLYFTDPDHDPNLEVLEALAGEKGDKFVALSNQDWKKLGIMSPVFDNKTAKIKGYRVVNSLQTRRMMATAVQARF